MTSNAPGTRPIRLLIAALGGQGGGVLAQWVVEAALRAGYLAQSTSIPGVAQRTGATTYYIELFPVPIAALGGRAPVMSLYPTPGAIDVVVASELLEAARVMQAGMVTPDCTHLVTSTSRTLTTAEKMALGDGRFSSERLLAIAEAHAARITAFDMDALARDAGTLVSAVMLGAIAGTDRLPIAREHYEAVIRVSGTGVEGSLRGFAAGLAAHGDTAVTGRILAAVNADAAWPAAIADIVHAGVARMVDFQDEAYADLYRQRVCDVLAAERAIDPEAGHGLAMTREFARFLALWMAFDDIVRVAALKVSRRRFERVRAEVGASPDDIVRIIDHFKPRVPEIAALVPRAAADALLRWDARRARRGRAPFAWAMHLRSDGVPGMVALRVLAGLKAWRRRGTRYAEEQESIMRWMQAVLGAAGEDWQLAHEVALSGRLVKGYGETNERGKRNLTHILEHLAFGEKPPTMRAAAIREAREAALTDEGGQALDATLVRHGAPARPIVPQPIRWVPKARAAPETELAP